MTLTVANSGKIEKLDLCEQCAAENAVIDVKSEPKKKQAIIDLFSRYGHGPTEI